MAQRKNWDQEYQQPHFVTKKADPQNDTLRFFKYAQEQGVDWKTAHVLDLGSGTGRNANYLAKLGSKVCGIEISPTAIELASARAKQLDIQVEYINQSIGISYPFPNEKFDVVLDVTSSNALSEKERELYLKETSRVLKAGGVFFVRALCKDGDQNAKKLLKLFPSKEMDTYTMPKTKLTERVFTEADFRRLYGQYFTVEKLMRKSGYTIFDGQPYKRNYWLAYLKKGT